MREEMRAPHAGRRAYRDEKATTAPASPGVFTRSSATVPPCEKPMSTVRLAVTPKLVCSRRTRSSTSGSTDATRSRWLSTLRPRVGYQSWGAPPRASGANRRGAREAGLEPERDRDHRLRGRAAAVQKDEQMARGTVRSWREAKDPARRHAPRLLTRDDGSVN